MPTVSQNSGTGFAAALSHTAMVLPFNRSVQKQGSNNQLVGRATRKAMALPTVQLVLQTMLQHYHWMIVSGGGF